MLHPHQTFPSSPIICPFREIPTKRFIFHLHIRIFSKSSPYIYYPNQDCNNKLRVEKLYPHIQLKLPHAFLKPLATTSRARPLRHRPNHTCAVLLHHSHSDLSPASSHIVSLVNGFSTWFLYLHLTVGNNFNFLDFNWEESSNWGFNLTVIQGLLQMI